MCLKGEPTFIEYMDAVERMKRIPLDELELHVMLENAHYERSKAQTTNG